MTGPLLALYHEQEALNGKLKDLAQIGVAEAVERKKGSARTAIGSRSSSKGAATRPVAGLENLMRPTAALQVRQSLLEQERSGQSEEVLAQWHKPNEKEETEEQRARWERFHHRSSVFQREREKYLESMRKKKEENELAECKLAGPKQEQKHRPHGRAKSGSLLDRAKAMDAKKNDRMKKLRQELSDKEMAQCSFKPNISPCEPHSYSGSRRPSGETTASSRVCSAGSYASSRRPSCDTTVSSGGCSYSRSQRPSSDMTVPSGTCEPRSYSGYGWPCSDRTGREDQSRIVPKPRAVAATAAEKDSDGSEYWDGSGDDDCDEKVSVGSAGKDDFQEATLLPREFESEHFNALKRFHEKAPSMSSLSNPVRRFSEGTAPLPGTTALAAALRGRTASMSCIVQKPMPLSSIVKASDSMEINDPEGLFENFSDLEDFEDEEWMNGQSDRDSEKDMAVPAEASVLNFRPQPRKGGR